MTSASGGPVLVAVGRPAHVQQLVRTAADLARDGTGRVRIVTVVAKPRGSPFGLFADETIRREYAADSRDLVERARAPPDVDVERSVVVDRSVARGVLSAVAAADPAALVVGWHGATRRTDALLGTTVDRLVERAPCDLYVERVGREADGVDAVLLPVAGGPHVDAATTAAQAIAAHNDARVHVLSVHPADPDAAERAARFVAAAREMLAAAAPDLPVTTETVAGDAVDELVAAADGHDVVVFGATRKGPLRGRLVGSVPRRIVERTDVTVVLARDGDVVGGRLDALRGLWRR